MGTTEESALDSLAEILDLRDKFREEMIQLDGAPDGIGDEEATVLLRHGTEVEILGVPGFPVIVSGEVQDLLTKNNFDVTFVGINGKEVKSKVEVARKIWFASSTRTLKSNGEE